MKIETSLKIAVACLLLFVGHSAYGQGAATQRSKPDLLGSTTSDGLYKNPFLGFEMRVPQSWNSMSTAEQSTAKSVGSDGLKAQSSTNDREIDEAVEAETVVLSYAKRPIGSPQNSIMAVGVGKQPSNKVTPRMVVEAAKELFLKSSENKLIQDITVETIGGKPFATMVMDMTINGQTIRLKYFATMIRDYSVTVSIVASDPESAKVADTSLRSIKFTGK